MGIYLLKSTACLAILLLFYKLFLEKEKIHIHKRFYLLSTILLAFCIPLITYTTYIEIIPESDHIKVFPETDNTLESVNTLKEYTTFQLYNYLPTILWTVYGIGVFIFGLRFSVHLLQIHNKISRNETVKNNRFINVLMQDLISPHTFFNYIFINKKHYEANEIPKEVFWHEQTHAAQKHSLDILFIELVQILFWFNPLIYILKKFIKLNHEFLADQAVLNKGVNTSEYQKTLLAFSSNALQPQLANAINYSLIKKRFTVMKTQSSKTSIWIRSTLLLPLLAFLLLSFSNKKEIVKDIETKTVDKSSYNYTARSLTINILNDGTYLIDNVINVNKNNFNEAVNNMHQDINSEIRNNILNVHVSSKFNISHEDVWFIYNSLFDYGFYRIVTDNQEIIKSKGNTPIKEKHFYNTQKTEEATKFNSVQKEASQAEINEYNALAEKYNGMDKEEMVVKKKEIARLKYLYQLMSPEQRKNAEPFPNIPPPPAPKAPSSINAELPAPPPIPENATEKEKIKYKEAIKQHKLKTEKIKAQKEKALKKAEVANRVKLEREKLEKVKARKAEAKNKDSQVAARLKRLEEREAQIKERKSINKVERLNRNKERESSIAARKNKLAEEKQARFNTLKEKAEERKQVLTEEKIRRVEEREKVKQERAELAEKRSELRRISPSEFIKKMIGKDATFYFNGAQISSEEALKLSKKKKINISSTHLDSDKPIIYLSDKPIVREVKKENR